MLGISLRIAALNEVKLTVPKLNYIYYILPSLKLSKGYN
jgi:hypothetical protein